MTMAVNISVYCSIRSLYTLVCMYVLYVHVCKYLVNYRNIYARMYLHTYVHTWSLQGMLYVYT